MRVLVTETSRLFRLALPEVFRDLNARRRLRSPDRLRAASRNVPAADAHTSTLFLLFMLLTLLPLY
jgi:hypothetical protein